MNKAEKYPRVPQNRRCLQHIPDDKNRRKDYSRRSRKLIGKMNIDKFNSDYYEFDFRYDVNIPVKIKFKDQKIIRAHVVNLSVSGALLSIDKSYIDKFKVGKQAKLKFNIPEGAIREDLQHKIRSTITIVRIYNSGQHNGNINVAVEFNEQINLFLKRTRWITDIAISSIFIGIILVLITFMRYNNYVYFIYNPWIYGFSIATTLYLLSRYIFSLFYKDVPIDPEYTPGVSIIIPCFNEEEWIHKTITNALDQYYPMDKIQVVIVDDCSSDDSVSEIYETLEILKKNCPTYKIEERVKVVCQQENHGKKIAIAEAMKHVTHDLIVFVDSDSFLQPLTIRTIVQPFIDPKMGGVTGRTEIENAWTNAITKMQTVRYYISFRINKAAESVFDAVTCLAGPLSCYRRELIENNLERWVNEKIFGHEVTCSDDRSMTNYVLETHRTCYQDSSICRTIAPSTMKVFYKQQMRWQRSWFIESIRGCGFMWKKEPLHSIFYLFGFLVPILAPYIVLYNVVYVTIMKGVLPWEFLGSICLMGMMMSFTYLILRKSRIWIHGFLFCMFYLFVFLWQMPIVMVTFWKSTWGTRETKHDVNAMNKKNKRKNCKEENGLRPRPAMPIQLNDESENGSNYVGVHSLYEKKSVIKYIRRTRRKGKHSIKQKQKSLGVEKIAGYNDGNDKMEKTLIR